MLRAVDDFIIDRVCQPVARWVWTRRAKTHWSVANTALATSMTLQTLGVFAAYLGNATSLLPQVLSLMVFFLSGIGYVHVVRTSRREDPMGATGWSRRVLRRPRSYMLAITAAYVGFYLTIAVVIPPPNGMALAGTLIQDAAFVALALVQYFIACRTPVELGVMPRGVRAAR